MHTPFLPGLVHVLAPMGRHLRRLRSTPAPELELFFRSLFPESLFTPAKSGQNSRNRDFTLQRTFWLLLFQALKPKTALREACHQLRALLALSSEGVSRLTSGAYSKARGRFPRSLLWKALHFTARAAAARAGQSALLQGRTIRLIDATCLHLADTPRNQRRFPQPSTQAPGCGFPLMKVIGLFCLSSGAAVACATARQSVHDTRLARKLWRHLQPGEVLVGDRAFGDFTTLATLPGQKVDVLARLHQTRSPDFRRPHRRLGPGDALFVWSKPSRRPRGVSQAQWDRLPDQITVRVVRSRLERAGFRTRQLSLVTTLLDPKDYPAEEIAQVYRRRWRIELSFRDLKTTMAMEHLRAQSPEIATKEMLAALVAYNLVRITMAEAAQRHEVNLERLSFKGTVDALRQYSQVLSRARSQTAFRRLRRELFRAIASDPVPLREGRLEPRVIKRRPKHFPKLKQPRHLYRQTMSKTRRRSNPPLQPASHNAP